MYEGALNLLSRMHRLPYSPIKWSAESTEPHALASAQSQILQAIGFGDVKPSFGPQQ